MIRHGLFFLCLLCATTVFNTASMAVNPDEVLKDQALEARARDLSQELRCVVCQNQSIDDSNAPLARDLRVILRERLKAGDTDNEAMDYIVGRYGNFVLLKPPFQWNTLLLWLGPVLIFLLALTGFWTITHRRAGAAGDVPQKLSPEEREELQTILSKGPNS